MKRRIMAWGIVVAVASGCGGGGNTASSPARGVDDVRNTHVDTPRESQSQSGGGDMPGKGRGSEPHRGKN